MTGDALADELAAQASDGNLHDNLLGEFQIELPQQSPRRQAGGSQSGLDGKWDGPAELGQSLQIHEQSHDGS